MLHLLEAPVYEHITDDRRRKKPSTRRESNPQPLCYEECALLLCYNPSHLNFDITDEISLSVEEQQGTPLVPLLEEQVPLLGGLVKRGAVDQTFLAGEAGHDRDVLVEVAAANGLLEGQRKERGRGVVVDNCKQNWSIN